MAVVIFDAAELEIMLETGDELDEGTNDDENADVSNVLCCPGVGELDENPVSLPAAEDGRPPNKGESL